MATISRDKIVAKNAAYLPILVIIISVPISWNRRHNSSFSSETLTLGSGLALAAPLLAREVAAGPMLCIMESSPRWGPKGNPEEIDNVHTLSIEGED